MTRQERIQEIKKQIPNTIKNPEVIEKVAEIIMKQWGM